MFLFYVSLVIEFRFLVRVYMGLMGEGSSFPWTTTEGTSAGCVCGGVSGRVRKEG